MSDDAMGLSHRELLMEMREDIKGLKATVDAIAKDQALGAVVRFEAALPNELWQADTTHWRLADGTDIEILDLVDDHSRLCLAADAFPTVTAADVVRTFHAAAERYGLPAVLLTDHGAVFNGGPRRGKVLLQSELERLGILPSTRRPTIPRRAARSSAFIRPSSGSWPGSREPPRWRCSRPSSMATAPTTTPSGRIGALRARTPLVAFEGRQGQARRGSAARPLPGP